MLLRGPCEHILTKSLQRHRTHHGAVPTLTSSLLSHLRKCGVQIQEQAQELTQLQQKLQEGRALSQLIHQNLQALLTQQDPDSCQSRQLLTELLKLTEHLVAKLSTGKVAKALRLKMVSSWHPTPHFFKEHLPTVCTFV